MRPLRRRDADDLPGSVRVAEPAPLGRPHRSASRCASTASSRGASSQARVRELLVRVGLPADAAVALPARVLGRPAAAHRHRARARRQPGLHRLRRAGLGARRLDPGADHQPARRAAERLRPHVSLHRARPRGRPPHLRPDRRHVPRHGRRGLAGGRPVREPAAPVHDLAALGRADPRPRRRAQPRDDPAVGRLAEPRESAVGLPLPHALPVRAADALPRRGAAASPALAGTTVACHWAEEIRTGQIQPREREPVFAGRAAPRRFRCRRPSSGGEDRVRLERDDLQLGRRLAQERADEEELVEVAVRVLRRARAVQRRDRLRSRGARRRRAAACARRRRGRRRRRTRARGPARPPARRCSAATARSRVDPLELAADALERVDAGRAAERRPRSAARPARSASRRRSRGSARAGRSSSSASERASRKLRAAPRADRARAPSGCRGRDDAVAALAQPDVAVGPRDARVRRRPQLADQPQLLERRLELGAEHAPLDPLDGAERRLDLPAAAARSGSTSAAARAGRAHGRRRAAASLRSRKR